MGSGAGAVHFAGSAESIWKGKGRLLGRQHNTPLTFSNE